MEFELKKLISQAINLYIYILIMTNILYTRVSTNSQGSMSLDAQNQIQSDADVTNLS